MSPNFTCGRFRTRSEARNVISSPSCPRSVTLRVFWSIATTVACTVTTSSRRTVSSLLVVAVVDATGAGAGFFVVEQAASTSAPVIRNAARDVVIGILLIRRLRWQLANLGARLQGASRDGLAPPTR